MTRFEQKSCKVLGIILFLLIVLLGLQLSGCNLSQLEMKDKSLPDYIDEVEVKNLV